MVHIPVHNLGSIGIVKDLPPHLIPPEAWSDGKNIRFADNLVQKLKGHSNVFGTPSVAPLWAIATGNQTNIFWVYADATTLRATDGGTHGNVSRTVGGAYSMSNDALWNGGLLAGIPVITNGVDLPQFQAQVGLGTTFENLTNWPSTYTCNVIRPFKNFLVALYIVKSGTESPHMVKWSHPAVPGAIPSSWDETDPTLNAGEVELTDALAGAIVDARILRDILVIYKERSTWGMQFTNDRNVFRFYPIFESMGAMTEGVSVSLGSGRHFVVSGEEVFVHNGQQVQFVFDKLWHKFIVNNLNEGFYKRSFTVRNPIDHEVWFCFPEVGSDWPSLAVVWNQRDGTIAARDLPGGISHIALGPIPGADASFLWDDQTYPWDTSTDLWGDQSFIPYQAKLLQSNKNTTNLQQIGETNDFDGTPMSAYVERSGIALIGQDRQGNPKADFEIRKLGKRIWPKVTGGPINVRMGSQENLGSPIMWATPQAFDPSSQRYLDFLVNGRLLAVRFESSAADIAWTLEGYDLEVEPLGKL